MRELIIKRNKTFVGCISKLKVYIEDSESTELTIKDSNGNDVCCRKLGDIKNGEQKTFYITEQAARVFVIFDKLSRNYCNDFYQLPEGDFTIFLSGQCHYNPAAGNAFRFDGAANEQMIANRKKGTKKGLVILIFAMVIGFAVGFLATSGILKSPQKPETFTVDNMKITLTDEFAAVDNQGFDAIFASNTTGVFVLKESFSFLEDSEIFTLEQYGQLVLENNGYSDDIVLQTTDGITYFEYVTENEESDDDLYFFVHILKASDAFWMVQFSTYESQADEMMPFFIEWAKSIEFSE